MTTKLDYVSGSTVIPDDAFGISPSGLHRFFSEPWNWYGEMVLGNAPAFQGSTSTVLGTIVHYVGEEFANTQSVDKSEIWKYICKECNIPYPGDVPEDADDEFWEVYFSEFNTSELYDTQRIIEQYRPMGNALIQYLSKTGLPQHTEDLISREVLPGYYACGSADAVHGDCLIDYKTTSVMSPSEKIPFNYRLQLLTYAWIYKGMGIDINRIRIVWITNNETGRVSEKTGKPLKDYPSKVVPVTQSITQEDFEYIENILKLVAETVEKGKDCLELVHLLYKDYRLKQ